MSGKFVQPFASFEIPPAIACGSKSHKVPLTSRACVEKLIVQVFPSKRGDCRLAISNNSSKGDVMRHSNSGALLMGLFAAAALALCIYNYVTPFTGIDGSYGALLVIVSTTILVLLAFSLQM